MSEAIPTTTPCPRCAVAVPRGYPRCPRCHAAMPAESTAGPRAKRETMRERLIAGGTAVPEPESGGFPWLFAAVGAAAAIAAVTWYLMRGAPAASAADPVGTAAAVPTEVTAPAVDAGDSEPPPPPTVDPRPRQRAAALAALTQALAKDQLWATVTESRDTVVIRSAFCHESGLAARVDAARAQLATLGYQAIRCLEQSGAEVFNQRL